MTTLIIARHGNTFTAEQAPTRVGARTDLPLVPKGEEQGRALGLALAGKGYRPDLVYVSHLQRTQQTAARALKAMGIERELTVSAVFDEIDYGPDENQPERAVIARIGQAAIDAWDTNASVPEGWKVDPDAIIAGWQAFSDGLLKSAAGKTTLVVTSNGTARFAPYLTGDYPAFVKSHAIKLSTGAFGILTHNGKGWSVEEWNTRP